MSAPSKLIAAAVRRVEPGDAVEDRALARSVRPDQAEDLALVDLERDLVDRPQGAEPLGEPGYVEHRHAGDSVGACPARDAAAAVRRTQCATRAGASPRRQAPPGSLRSPPSRAGDTERDITARRRGPWAAAAPASIVLMLDGQAILVTPSTYCITTGEERSFWPDIWLAGREELHAVALHGAAFRNVGLERGLAQRLRIVAAVLLDRARQHVGEEDVGVVEAHRGVRRHFLRAGLGLVALDHLGGEIGDARLQRLRIEQLRRHRIDIVEIVHVLAERLDQLVDLAVAGAVADQRHELQARFLGLAQEQRDVRIVAGVQDHVGLRAAQLGHQRGEIGRGRRIGFLVHDLHAELFALRLVAHRDADAVGAVLVDDRDLEVLHLLAELRLGVLGEELARGFAELVRMDLRPEHVLQLPVLEHRGGDAGVDPHELLGGVDLGGHRHAMRARIDAHDQVDLLLVEQPLGLVDRHVGLRLRIREDADDLVALDAAALVDQVDGDLVADAGRLRSAARERAGVVVDGADLDVGGMRGARECAGE